MPIETKASDQFPTDAWLMAVFREWFDPCPLNANPEINGLEIPWQDRTYCNPPYSNVLPWVEKAIHEHKEGKRIVMLLKFDLTTEAHRRLLQEGGKMLHVGVRLHHGHPYASPYPSVLWVLT